MFSKAPGLSGTGTVAALSPFRTRIPVDALTDTPPSLRSDVWCLVCPTLDTMHGNISHHQTIARAVGSEHGMHVSVRSREKGSRPGTPHLLTCDSNPRSTDSDRGQRSATSPSPHNSSPPHIPSTDTTPCPAISSYTPSRSPRTTTRSTPSSRRRASSWRHGPSRAGRRRRSRVLARRLAARRWILHERRIGSEERRVRISRSTTHRTITGG